MPQPAPAPTKTGRPRGRPRKHPLPQVEINPESKAEAPAETAALDQPSFPLVSGEYAQPALLSDAPVASRPRTASDGSLSGQPSPPPPPPHESEDHNGSPLPAPPGPKGSTTLSRSTRTSSRATMADPVASKTESTGAPRPRGRPRKQPLPQVAPEPQTEVPAESAAPPQPSSPSVLSDATGPDLIFAAPPPRESRTASEGSPPVQSASPVDEAEDAGAVANFSVQDSEADGSAAQSSSSSTASQSQLTEASLSKSKLKRVTSPSPSPTPSLAEAQKSAHDVQAGGRCETRQKPGRKRKRAVSNDTSSMTDLSSSGEEFSVPDEGSNYDSDASAVSKTRSSQIAKVPAGPSRKPRKRVKDQEPDSPNQLGQLSHPTTNSATQPKNTKPSAAESVPAATAKRKRGRPKRFPVVPNSEDEGTAPEASGVKMQRVASLLGASDVSRAASPSARELRLMERRTALSEEPPAQSDSVRKRRNETIKQENEAKRAKALEALDHEREMIEDGTHPLLLRMLETLEAHVASRRHYAALVFEAKLEECDRRKVAEDSYTFNQWTVDKADYRFDLLREEEVKMRRGYYEYMDEGPYTVQHTVPPPLPFDPARLKSGEPMIVDSMSQPLPEDRASLKPWHLTDDEIHADFEAIGFSLRPEVAPMPAAQTQANLQLPSIHPPPVQKSTAASLVPQARPFEGPSAAFHSPMKSSNQLDRQGSTLVHLPPHKPTSKSGPSSQPMRVSSTSAKPIPAPSGLPTRYLPPMAPYAPQPLPKQRHGGAYNMAYGGPDPTFRMDRPKQGQAPQEIGFPYGVYDSPVGDSNASFKYGNQLPPIQHRENFGQDLHHSPPSRSVGMAPAFGGHHGRIHASPGHSQGFASSPRPGANNQPRRANPPSLPLYAGLGSHPPSNPPLPVSSNAARS